MGAKISTIQEAIDGMNSHFLPENAEGVEAVFQLEFTGDGGGQWYLSIENGELTVTEGQFADPSITLTVAAEDWIKIINGETRPTNLLMTGRIKLTGDMGLAVKFQSMFSRSSSA